MKKTISKSLLCTGVFLAMVCAVGLCSSDSHAESAGGWIGSGSPSTGGNGGGGWAGGCSGDAAAYLLECQGYSWIFYRYIGGEKGYKGDMPFRRDSSYNEISGECAKHGSAGGFWHFGWNMRGLSYNGRGFFGDLYYLNGISGARVTYSTSVGGRGHYETFTPNMVGSGGIYSWANYYTKSDADLDHIIYVDGKATYKAEKYGSRNKVAAEYKQACMATGKSENECKSIPGRTYAFCWWPGMDESNKFKGTSAIMKGNENVTWPTATEKNDTPWITKSGDKQTAELTTSCGDEGCEMTFRHYLRRVSGKGGTKYTISRQVISGRPEVIGPNSLPITESVSGSSFDNDKEVYPKGSNERNTGSTIRMYPGDRVCETMKFSVDGGNNYAESTVCATIEPEEVVDEQKDAFLGIGVMNDTTKKSIYGDLYAPVAYAKPRDTVIFQVQYNPAPQQYVDCSGGSSWKNAYSVSATGFSYFKNTFYNCGEYDEKFEANSYVIGSRQVGSDNILGETAVINPVDKNGQRINTAIWTTPTKAIIGGGGASISGGQLFSSARVLVPYNFNTGVGISNREDEVVYAGEEKKIVYQLDVVNRRNDLTTNGGESNAYKTLIRNPKVKTIVYYGTKAEGEFSSVRGGGEDGNELCGYFGGVCEESGVETYKNNRSEEILEDSGTGNMTIDIQDMAAGNPVCVAVAMYPASSSKDENDNANMDASGSQTWHISESRCFKVAKRPNFQVWGGNVAANSISAWSATKKINDGMRLFGSWGELAVSTPNGENNTMASGAAWGYASNNDGALQPNPSSGETSDIGEPGGGTSNVKCDYSRLTFGSECGMLEGLGGGSGEMNESTIATMAKQIKEKLEKVDNYFYSNAPEIRLGEEELVDNKRFYENTGNISILTDIRIDRSNSDNNFSKLDDVPQVAIYAKNIDIACNVGRIDAILIAEKTINTCADIEGDVLKESSAAQNQLIINGAMYANTIHFDRTYGAGTGTRSIVPAEIVNYDNSMLFTGSSGGGTANGDGVMDVVYVRELAPRY